MLKQDQLETIKNELFRDADLNVYAVVDGAACPELRFKIYDHKPQSSCLWSGKLEPDIEEVAPYMVLLENNSEFTDWLIVNGFERHWNIFISSELEPKEFRKQIRKLQLVRGPDSTTKMFRFYDPRVLGTILPTLDANQLEELFTNIRFLYIPNSRLHTLNIHLLETLNQTVISKELSILKKHDELKESIS